MDGQPPIDRATDAGADACRDKMKEAILNLYKNAEEAMPAGAA